MKKLILLTILIISNVIAGSFIMSEGKPLIKADENTNDQTIETPEPDQTIITPDSDWTPKPLPSTKFNVLEYGLKGDGVTDDSSALKNLAKNKNITNWYFPEGRTFLLSGVYIPHHVKFVFGGGTIITKNYDATYPEGALVVDYTTTVDGLKFISDPLRPHPSTSTARYYGMVRVGNTGSIEYQDEDEFISNGIEIRNCSFDSKHRTADQISVYTGNNDDRKHKNLKIYNNTFTNPGHFSMEVGDRTTPVRDDQNALFGLEIFNNFVDGGGRYEGGFSISRVRPNSNAKIYNNKLINVGWGFELAASDGLEVYNNTILNARTHAISSNGPQAIEGYTSEADLSPGKNFVHHNHIEASDVPNTLKFINLYSCSKDSFYENYIKIPIKAEKSPHAATPKESCVGPEIKNNTIIGNYNWTVRTVDTVNTVIQDNIIYGTFSTGQTPISINSSLDTIVTGNNIYVKTNNECISGLPLGANECTKNYTGAIPSSRSGAGLSDPNNIGTN